jgi:hypothetical protein
MNTQHPPNKEHVKIHFQPDIWLTTEGVARHLNISVEKADQLLSGPEVEQIYKAALSLNIQNTLSETSQQLARQKWPSVMDRQPIRQDVNVQLKAPEVLAVSEI